jgi:hypothetical protein
LKTLFPHSSGRTLGHENHWQEDSKEDTPKNKFLAIRNQWKNIFNSAWRNKILE